MRKIPTRCPHCGCTEAMTRERAMGPVHVYYDLDARTIDWSRMHDVICYRGGAILYCVDCGKRIGRIEDAVDFRDEYQ